jgi:hypothetical protein
MKLTGKIKDILAEPLGDDDIRFYFPNAKIMLYSDLQNYKSIDSLLPEENDYVFLLYENSPNNGHWVCVLRYDDTIEFFDSYGGAPDTQLSWTDCPSRHSLNQAVPYLTNLFKGCPYTVVYNPEDYQEERKNVNTCGRHCVFRVKNLMTYKRRLEDYYRLMKKLRKEMGLPYDIIVSKAVSKI